MRHFRLSDRSLFKATSAWLLSLELLRLQFGDKVGDMSTAAEDFETLPVVTTVDVFVSHAWSTSAGLKYLGICHYLNLGAAVKAACTAWMFTGACLVVQAGGVSRVATASGASGLLELVGMLVYWPMLVFFLVYFLGHRWHRERYWFDKLCVHQHDPEMKNRAICSLPLFVMNSRRLLVLWDESYFERLWCSYEMAIFAKSSGDPTAITFIPMWLPVWTLSALLIDLVGVICIPAAEDMANLLSQGIVGQYGPKSRTAIFLTTLLTWFCPLGSYLLLTVPIVLCNLKKIRLHQQMLKQMAEYDLRSASCSLESDREAIEAQVLGLFDEALEPPLSIAVEAQDASVELSYPLVDRSSLNAVRHITSYPGHEEIFDIFHSYVRGPLRDSLVGKIGSESDVSLSLCMITFLPLNFLSLASILGCDGDECASSAAKQGYSSVQQYMATNTISWLVAQVLSIPTVHPLLLRMLKSILPYAKTWLQQALLGLLCAVLVHILVFALLGAMLGLLAVAVTTDSMWYFAGFLVAMALLLLQTWFLFFRYWQQDAARRSASLDED